MMSSCTPAPTTLPLHDQLAATRGLDDANEGSGAELRPLAELHSGGSHLPNSVVG